MTAGDLSYDEVGNCLRKCGYYRVRRAQTVCNSGPPDGISGATMLALGMRETRLKNVNGGARWDSSSGTWVQTKTDKGVFQIASEYHMADLRRMLGVDEGTWGPVVEQATALDDNYCPRYEESLQFTLMLMHEHQAFAMDSGISEDELGRFAVVAHNAGLGGALRGYREGEPDRYTAYQNYSQWVLRHRTIINRWLNDHLKWRV